MNNKDSQPPDASLPLRSDAPSSGKPTPRKTARAQRPVDPKLEIAAKKYSEEHDGKSFGTLFCAAQKPMKAVVRKLGVRAHSIEDVVNEAGLILWTQRADFHGKYLDFVDRGCGIAHYQALNAGRAARRWQHTTLVAHGSTPLCVGTEDGGSAASPEEALMVRDALQSLPSRDLQVLRWKAEGWSFEEIGEALGITLQGASQLHARILEDVRKAR